MRIYAAPLQGITTCLFRTLHAEMFGGVDRYFAPFLSPAPEHLLTERELRDLSPMERRDHPAFRTMFHTIWKELDVHES